MNEGHIGGIGVVIGRFQVPKLHPGHRHLFNEVMKRHRQIIVLVGCSAVGAPTDRDPMHFEPRRDMLAAELEPAAGWVFHYHPITDMPDDALWSTQVDTVINTVRHTTRFPGSAVRLYCSRAGFVDHYRGEHEVVYLSPLVEASGTESRANVVVPTGSINYRAGLIDATVRAFPTMYHTVDIAMLRRDERFEFPELALVAKKTDESAWQFPSGFVDPSDASLEAAASRKLREETGVTDHEGVQYVGSTKCRNWRYHGTKHDTMSVLFRCRWTMGMLVPGDGVIAARWFFVNNLPQIVPGHKKLIRLMGSDFKEVL